MISGVFVTGCGGGGSTPAAAPAVSVYDLCPAWGGETSFWNTDFSTLPTSWIASKSVQATVDKSYGSSWSLVLLPDTQMTAECWPEVFKAQTQWIADNQDALHIEFVLHEGDITNLNVQNQWTRALEAMSVLHGRVPYAMSVGNHDTGNDADVRDTRLFNIYFPYAGYAALADGDPQKVLGVFEQGKMDNAYYQFYAGGIWWMIVVLEFGPRDAVLNWANQVVADHAGHRVIVLTHDYLDYNGHLTGGADSQSWLASNSAMAQNGESVNDGIGTWDKFVRKHANISFVFNGHTLGDGAGRLISTGDNGNTVYQVSSDYTMRTLYEKGGEGWMRLVMFNSATGVVSVKTVNPQGQLLTNSQQEFQFTGVALNAP